MPKWAGVLSSCPTIAATQRHDGNPLRMSPGLNPSPAKASASRVTRTTGKRPLPLRREGSWLAHTHPVAWPAGSWVARTPARPPRRAPRRSGRDSGQPTQDPPQRRAHRCGGERGRPMAYAKIITQYPDESAVVVEVGHDDGCHPDLLDELVARCRDLWRETVADAVETDE